ncbi:hypothetical protein [Legionella bozemanae]|uniref:Uncharacterized protein n=1 Tax=Legionella bozemanae TaxID=447 RepID=A0A0W0RRF0_LEGBO|nr:hypothetical protein [Legionella bozemanae]KTC73641.1 hypothetical protein Lboz_2287 [Legionella bozemanae]STO34048.1 Uncharacterised protein [Legionella bozemanae]
MYIRIYFQDHCQTNYPLYSISSIKVLDISSTESLPALDTDTVKSEIISERNFEHRGQQVPIFRDIKYYKEYYVDCRNKTKQQVEATIQLLVEDGNLLNNTYRNELFLDDIKSSIQKLLEPINPITNANGSYKFFDLKKKLCGSHTRELDFDDNYREYGFR